MITVIVYSVMTANKYEFKLDTHVPVRELTEEIGEMICQREQLTVRGDMRDLILYSNENQTVLNADMTLSYYGIKTGQTLFLC